MTKPDSTPPQAPVPRSAATDGAAPVTPPPTPLAADGAAPELRDPAREAPPRQRAPQPQEPHDPETEPPEAQQPEAQQTEEPPADKEDEPEQTHKTKGRRRLLIFLAIAVAILLIAGLLYYFLYARNFVSTDDAFVDAQIVSIAPQTSGQLTEVPVQNNSTVTAGQVLARIDAAGPKAAYDQAQASLENARTGVTSAEAQLEEANANVAQAQSSFDAARVTAENDKRTADRLTRLKNDSGNTAVSQQQIDDAVAAANSAAADQAKAKTAVQSAQAGVDAAKAAVAAARAQVRSAMAGVASAQVTLDHLTVTAPSDGQIVQVNVDRGSYVATGTQIMALVPNHLYVTANFKETQLQYLHPGQSVDLAVDAYPGASFKGKVVSVQRGAGQAFQLLPAQNATGNYVKVVQRVPVRISIENPDLKKYVLGPGMSVVPTVRIDSQ